MNNHEPGLVIKELVPPWRSLFGVVCGPELYGL